MKQFLPILLFALFLSASADAQEAFQSPFRKGSYTRLGIEMMGHALNNNLTAKQNITAGNFGNKLGFVFEKGRIFYMAPKEVSKRINYGIDWNILSLSFHYSKKEWEKFVANKPGASADAAYAISIGTKIGPAISVNPVEKLVIDVRAQLAAGIYFMGPTYEEGDPATYTFYMLGSGGFGKSITSAIKPNFGITLRRGGIGLAFDYSPGKMNVNYTESINDVKTYGNAKVPANAMQVKLNFSLKK